LAKDTIVVKVDAQGRYHVEGVARANIASISVADVDIIIETKDGGHYVLPLAGMEAMDPKPPEVIFSDGTTTADQLLTKVGTVTNLTLNIPVPSTLEHKGATEDHKTEDQKPPEQNQQQAAALNENHEKSVEQLVEQAQKITENLHTTDNAFVPPHQFEPPPNAFAPPPGVPPPISLTPITTLFMGNVVGSTSSVNAGVTTIYGGAGADGSGAVAQLGPRDALQFSNAVITGTSGPDIIYAEGPGVGNSNPAISTTSYAKEFLLNVAGYFTSLNDIVFTNVPTGVSITGATHNTDGSWTLPSSYVLNQQAFTLVYDKTAVASGQTFDITATINGLTTRHVTFNSVQTFRFEYLNVTNADQVTDPTLVYNDKGQSKEIYILPLLDQPNTINSGDGNDQIFGGLGADTINTGNSNNIIYAYAGDNIISTGTGADQIHVDNGNNTISDAGGANSITAGSGNNHITLNDGNNTVLTGNGNNTISTGVGSNSITTGTGNDSITTSGGGGTISASSGNNTIIINSLTGSTDVYSLTTTGTGTNTITGGDDNYTINVGGGTNNITLGTSDNSYNTTITAGNGANTIVTGDGKHTISVGSGVNAITTGAGVDTISAAGGGGSINAGDGNNSITITSSSGSTNNYTITTTGTGTNSITGSDDNYNISTGSGVDTISVGNGNQTINVGDGATNSATAGNGTDILIGGSGNDTLIAGNGTNTFRGGTGTNTLTGGSTGNSTVDYSTVAGVVTVALGNGGAAGTATGTSLSDTLTYIQNVIANDAGDTITGSNTSNTLTGGAGNDTIAGNGGNDTIYGNGGDDTLTGGTGNDNIYGGSGNNTIDGGSSGTDNLFGGSGNNTFINPHAGVHYDGTNGANISAMPTNLAYSFTNGGTTNLYLNTQINAINYGSDNSGLTINLAAGTGIGGTADGSTYAATPTSGYDSINKIIVGNGTNNLAPSFSDTVLIGGTGRDIFTDTNTIASQHVILVGGGGNTDDYNMGAAQETIVGSVSGFDRLFYNSSSSPAGIVINLDSANHNFTNSLGNVITVAAYSGGNNGVTSADSRSWSNGDYFEPISGTSTAIDQIIGTQTGGDVIFNGSNALTYSAQSSFTTATNTVTATTGGVNFNGYQTIDYFYGGSGNDVYNMSYNADRADGGTGGFDVFRTTTGVNSQVFNITVYLNGSLNTSDATVTSPINETSGGVTYTGYAYGWNNSAPTAATTTLFSHFENIVGYNGNDTLVGDDTANQINGGNGSNIIYGLGGNDIITAIEGVNTIDGGAGTDTVNFQFASTGPSGSLGAYSVNPASGDTVFFADGTFFNATSDRNLVWGDSIHSAFQARTSGGYSTITNVENINGSDYTANVASQYDEVLYGNTGTNAIYGNAGNDIIAGGGGADSLYGGTGNDIFYLTPAQLTAASVINGDLNASGGSTTGTDTLRVPGWGNAVASGNAFGVTDPFSSSTAGTNTADNAKFVSIEVLDVRTGTDTLTNSAGAITITTGTTVNSVHPNFVLDALDIQNLADLGTSSVITLKLDSGETFSTAVGAGTGALTALQNPTHTATDTTYRFYSDASHGTYNNTNLVATVNVHFGA